MCSREFELCTCTCIPAGVCNVGRLGARACLDRVTDRRFRTRGRREGGVSCGVAGGQQHCRRSIEALEESTAYSTKDTHTHTEIRKAKTNTHS